MKREELTQEIVKELLHYDPETGLLYWKERDVKWFGPTPIKTAESVRDTWNSLYSGNIAGGQNKKTKYHLVKPLKKTTAAHRLIWLWVHGEWPEFIDHKNGIRNDNRLSNLRSVDRMTNAQNMKTSFKSVSGCKGVTWFKPRQMWRVRILINKQVFHLGLFDDLEEAKRVYSQKAREAGFTERHINS